MLLQTPAARARVKFVAAGQARSFSLFATARRHVLPHHFAGNQGSRLWASSHGSLSAWPRDRPSLCCSPEKDHGALFSSASPASLIEKSHETQSLRCIDGHPASPGTSTGQPLTLSE